MSAEETDEQIEARIERSFALELTAVRALDELSDQVIASWPRQRPARREADRILAMAIARGTTTFKAVLQLIEAGYGREASMLNRSLFEGMAVAHWIAANPAEAERRFPRAMEFELHLFGEMAREIEPEEPDPPGAVRLDSEQLAEAKRLFGPYNERLWTGHNNVRELVADVENQWEEPGRGVLRTYLRYENRQNNKVLHASAIGLFGLVLDPSTNSEGLAGMTMRLGPGSDMLDSALSGAFYNHGMLLSLLVDHYRLGEGPAGEVRDVLSERQHAFAVIDRDVAKKTGRNQPCPCEGGRKFKDCHEDQLKARYG